MDQQDSWSAGSHGGAGLWLLTGPAAGGAGVAADVPAPGANPVRELAETPPTVRRTRAIVKVGSPRQPGQASSEAIRRCSASNLAGARVP